MCHGGSGFWALVFDDRQGERLVLVEDRSLEVAEGRARLESKLFVQHPLRVSIGLEGVRLPPAAVEGEDQLSAESFAQGVGADERAQLRYELDVAASLQVGVDAAFACGESELLERRAFSVREWSIDVGERLALKERVRLAQNTRPFARIGEPTRLCDTRAEGVEIELARLDPDQIARRLGDQPVPENLPETRDLVLERGVRVLRRSIPEVGRQPVG